MLNSNHAARRAVPKQPLIYAATPRANSSGTNSATCTVGITGRAGRDAAGRGMCRLQTLNVSSQLPRGRTQLFRQLWAVTSIESRDLLPATDVSEGGGEEERRRTRRRGKIIGMSCLLDCPQIRTCRRTFFWLSKSLPYISLAAARGSFLGWSYPYRDVFSILHSYRVYQWMTSP